MPTGSACEEGQQRSHLQAQPHPPLQQQLAMDPQQHGPPLLGSATDGSLLIPDQALLGCRSAVPSCHGERLERTQGCAACSQRLLTPEEWNLPVTVENYRNV